LYYTDIKNTQDAKKRLNEKYRRQFEETFHAQPNPRDIRRRMFKSGALNRTNDSKGPYRRRHRPAKGSPHPQRRSRSAIPMRSYDTPSDSAADSPGPVPQVLYRVSATDGLSGYDSEHYFTN
jgi:hypothetical protein